MKKFKLIFCILAIGALATSCASISKEECEVGSWADIGERDSSSGKNKSRFYRYVKDCNKHGINPDKKQYTEGYSAGLKSFCTASNGFETGRRGSSNPKICPKNLRSAFETSYRKGKSIHAAETKVKDAADKINSIERQINEAQNSLSSGTVSSSQAALVAMKVDKLRLQQRALEKDKVVLEKELAKKEAE